MKRLLPLLQKEEKLVVGLLSGTSVDGVDAALVRIRGYGSTTKAHIECFRTQPFRKELRRRLLSAAEADAEEICRLHFEVGEVFASSCLDLLDAAGVSAADVDLVGSHGQTIFHQPRATGESAATLQIGEADVIAERTGLPVVSDFRTRDVAAGGEGAPLSAYVDYLLFRNVATDAPRVLLNLGGIANLTVVFSDPERVFAFDAGPANMPLDEAVAILSGGSEHCDTDGRRAALGRVDQNLLGRLLEHPYLRKPVPKTTGRELFGRPFVEPLLRNKGTNRGVDVLATLTAFIAHGIRDAYESFVLPKARPTEMLVSGGGVHNLTLLGHLRRVFPDVGLRTLEEIGIDPDAKEALLFAILANETLHGVPNNLPGATGARWPTVLGKISP